MLGRVAIRARAKAEMVFPAVPSLAEHFTDTLVDHFAALGRPFSAHEVGHLRALLTSKLREAFDASPTSSVIVEYHTADDGTLRIDYGIAAATSTLAEQFDHWVKTREAPLFGALPDARVTAAARDLPASARVLDFGAGTGRNSLPLARLGLHVEAFEPSPALADLLEADAVKEGLSVRVTRARGALLSLDGPAGGPRPPALEASTDLATSPAIAPGSFDLVVASQVTSHFRGSAELRGLLELCTSALRPGGKALITAFVTRPDYHPDSVARQLGQVFWSTFFTPAELTSALDGLPLSIAEDSDALEYERASTPAESWPPTGWFEPWARGEDVFGPQASPPITLRWLVLERAHGGKIQE